MKLGLITIGQSPRTDITPDIIPIFGPDIELLQAGALDGLTKEEIAAFTPGEDDYVLISKLKDGSSVVFAERYILPRLQNCITSLENQGAQVIMFLCTGTFPDFESRVPVFYPCNILNGSVPALAPRGKIAVITPKEEQIEQCYGKWKELCKEVTVFAASPYGEPEELDAAAEKVRPLDVDAVLLDCMGFTKEMKVRFREKSGKLTILSRTLAARNVMELLD